MIASARRATSRATACVRLLLRAHGRRLGAAVRVRDERVAQVGDPVRARRLLHGGADEVHRARRRGREHDVDLVLARDADRRRDRGQVPADVLVGHEQAGARRGARGRARARRPPSRAAPRRACGPSGRGSARDAPTPGSARGARSSDGSTSGRPAPARASRSRAPAGTAANFSGRWTPPPPAGGK